MTNYIDTWTMIIMFKTNQTDPYGFLLLTNADNIQKLHLSPKFGFLDEFIDF